MISDAVNSVLYNIDQREDTSAADKKTARDNIGAVSADDVGEILGNFKPLQVPVEITYPDYAILKKLTQDTNGVVGIECSYIHCATQSDNGLMSSTDKTKLDGIQAGAELNVQSDWSQSDSTADDFIKNKPTIPAIRKLDYGVQAPTDISTLLLDADDPEGYVTVKGDSTVMGKLVQGPYKGLLDSGVNGVGDTSTPVYIDGNGEFATCTVQPGGKRRHDAELYFHHSDDGDHYNVRNIKNYCINHVAVTNHNQDICYLHIEAPTLTGDEEYDYTVVFDCTNSAGWVKVTVENADAELFANPTFHKVPQWLNIYGSDTSSDATTGTREIQVLNASNQPKYLEIGAASYASVPPAHPAGPLVLTADSSLYVDDVARNLIKLTGSPQYQVEVLGGRFTIHAF